jgi:hypothetical protein
MPTTAALEEVEEIVLASPKEKSMLKLNLPTLQVGGAIQ